MHHNDVLPRFISKAHRSQTNTLIHTHTPPDNPTSTIRRPTETNTQQFIFLLSKLFFRHFSLSLSLYLLLLLLLLVAVVTFGYRPPHVGYPRRNRRRHWNRFWGNNKLCQRMGFTINFPKDLFWMKLLRFVVCYAVSHKWTLIGAQRVTKLDSGWALVYFRRIAKIERWSLLMNAIWNAVIHIDDE